MKANCTEHQGISQTHQEGQQNEPHRTVQQHPAAAGSQLVRSTLAFSERVENHIGAIRYLTSHYNLERAALLV
jgi:hypothetical protein